MAAPSAGRDAVLLAAVALSMAPAAEEIGRHVALNEWAAYVVGMVPLVALTTVRAGGSGAPRRDGALWIAAALVIEMIGVVAGPAQIARLAIPIAAIGLARLRGRPALAGGLLACWLVPVPNLVVRIPSPGLEAFFLEIAAGAAALFGAAPRVEGVVVTAGDAALRVLRGDSGIPLAIALAGAGWYVAVRRGGGVLRAALCGARFAVAAPLLQLATLTGVVATLPWLGSEAARGVLTFAPFSAVTVLALALGEREPRPARARVASPA